MTPATFFAAIRPAFGNRLSQPQVDGMQAILDAARAAKVTDAHHVAHVLAHVRRETGGYMSPIKETVYPSHKNKNPTDAEVMQRLERAWARGQLPWVKKPYWRDGEFGRGQIQLTHAKNRAKFGIADRDDLLKLPVSARVAVVGMRDGLFTGKKLSDYSFPAALDAAPKNNPRRIVNGQDGSDAEVAKFHRQFHAALVKAGWSIDEPSTNHRRTIDKPATAPQKPAQRASVPPVSRAKETVSTVAGGATGAGLVVAVLAFADDAAQAWRDFWVYVFSFFN
jgi:predicted chitinase